MQLSELTTRHNVSPEVLNRALAKYNRETAYAAKAAFKERGDRPPEQATPDTFLKGARLSHFLMCIAPVDFETYKRLPESLLSGMQTQVKALAPQVAAPVPRLRNLADIENTSCCRTFADVDSVRRFAMVQLQQMSTRWPEDKSMRELAGAAQGKIDSLVEALVKRIDHDRTGIGAAEAPTPPEAHAHAVVEALKQMDSRKLQLIAGESAILAERSRPEIHRFSKLSDALAHLEGENGEMGKKILVQRGDATGDVSHVLACMGACEPDLGIIVLGSSDSIAKTYGQFKVPPSQVCVLSMPDGDADLAREVTRLSDCIGNAANAEHAQTMLEQARVGNPQQDPPQDPAAEKKYRVVGLTETSRIFAHSLRDQKRSPKKARAGAREKILGGPNEREDRHLTKLIRDVFKFDLKHNTVVYWCRASGSVTGQHPSQDHSDYALWQIVHHAVAEKGCSVIVAGDYNEQNACHDLIERFAAEHEGRVNVIGKFWEKDGVNLDRRTQIRMFATLRDLLNVEGKELVHVGPRSGGLDFYGFAGEPTLYLLGGDVPDQRMTNVVGAHEDQAGKGNSSFQRLEHASTRPSFGELVERAPDHYHSDNLLANTVYVPGEGYRRRPVLSDTQSEILNEQKSDLRSHDAALSEGSRSEERLLPNLPGWLAQDWQYPDERPHSALSPEDLESLFHRVGNLMEQSGRVRQVERPSDGSPTPDRRDPRG